MSKMELIISTSLNPPNLLLFLHSFSHRLPPSTPLPAVVSIDSSPYFTPPCARRHYNLLTDHPPLSFPKATPF